MIPGGCAALRHSGCFALRIALREREQKNIAVIVYARALGCMRTLIYPPSERSTVLRLVQGCAKTGSRLRAQECAKG